MDGLKDGLADALRRQLLERRSRLNTVVSRAPDQSIVDLLHDVDSALERLERGTFGLCDVCHEPIETERLLANPLICACLDHLSEQEKAALERDLDLAAEVQRRLLPPTPQVLRGWEICYLFRPFRIASGDYCDIISDARECYVLLGDVSGKGMAASMLAANLHGLFRTLLPNGGDLQLSLSRANRIFCESTIAAHYATLIAMAANDSGRVRLVNAGHCFPYVVGRTGVKPVELTGLPLGVFCESSYEVHELQIEPGEALFAFTDGLSESTSPNGEEYGQARLQDFLCRAQNLPAGDLIQACVQDLHLFRSGAAIIDDLTILCLRRQE